MRQGLVVQFQQYEFFSSTNFREFNNEWGEFFPKLILFENFHFLKNSSKFHFFTKPGKFMFFVSLRHV